MTIPRGKKLLLMNQGEYVVDNVPLIIDDDITLSLSSSFEPTLGGGDTKGLNFLGAALEVASRGRIQFSGQFKQLGYQQWTRTDPLAFTTTISFYMGSTDQYDAYEEIYKPMIKLASLALPSEGGEGGTLISPGPPPTALLQGSSLYKTRVISLYLGKILYISAIIVKRAEPLFSKETDERGYPIWGKITLDINSLVAATVQLLRGGREPELNREIFGR